MSNSESSQVLQMFSGLLKRFSGESEKAASVSAEPKAPLTAPSSLLDNALKELKDRKEALRLERESRQVVVNKPLKPSAEEVERLMAEIHGKIKADILDLHKTLSTKLSESELHSQRLFMLELAEVLAGVDGAGFEGKVRAAVIRHVASQCGRSAWSVLQALMEKADVQWPEPTGLSPWAEQKDMQAAKERMLSDIAESFTQASPARIAERMFGVISVWRANYPDQGSGQWKQISLEAVGYAILSKIVAEATVKLRKESDELMKQAMELIGAEAESVQQVLKGGISSPSEIDQVLNHVSGLCEEVLPDLAWKSIEQEVEKTAKSILA